MKRQAVYFMLLFALTACASAPKRDEVEGSWQVMVTHPGRSDMLCYTGSTPESSSGTLKSRKGKPYLIATRRPSGKIEISASAGYPFMHSSNVELEMDGETYSLVYKGSVAWAYDDEQDKDIVEDMEAAESIELHAVSENGQTSTDVYSPDGFDTAIERIRELCP